MKPKKNETTYWHPSKVVDSYSVQYLSLSWHFLPGRLFFRFMALTVLQNLVEVDKYTLIAMISEIVKVPQNEMVLGIRIYNLLGKLKARQALPLLHNRLTKLEQQVHQWRTICDQEYFEDIKREPL